MKKLCLTLLKSVFALIKETFKNPYITKDTTGEKHYIIDTNGLNRIKEECAKNEVYASPILLECMKQGYKFDIKLKSEIMKIFQEEGVIPVIKI